ncbi:mechanosensitive ion channel family protein [Flavobacterium subsaxonicum]|uniref:Mechanosensitive ion channel protein MscS n=1 Tax=Flavobacterium subsaxonicum WB 4.1-42 = DSM 21790 TaxID=1121898 RepID=A0A0A2MT91_9FLAO|nr:mechanosensitive ion channel domain-containing protein [Flavobacterium subsaxonicum]KGO94658.1 mechanosensitive ion channel protein MscS [Flavobacterium subsaxonicum WB 4.1-42 = DSM 21790]
MPKKITAGLFTLFLLLSVQLCFSQATPDKKHMHRGKLFDDEAVSDSDYLMSIENASEVLELAHTDAEFGGGTYRLFGEMESTKDKLDLILANLKEASPNVRNQQMYRTVLQEIEVELEQQNQTIDTKNANFDKIKDRIAGIRKDTLFTSLVRDTVQRKRFKTELLSLRAKYQSTDSLMHVNMALLSTKKRLTVQRKMAVSKALQTVESRLETSGVSIFGDEYPYLWHTETAIQKKELSANIKGKFDVEKGVVTYYSRYSFTSLITLAFFMGLVAWWILRNIKYLKNHGHFDNLKTFGFKYLNKGVLLPILVIGLNIAVVSNLYAPALFIEFLQLILLLILSLLFKGQWKQKSMRNWLLLIALFFVLCFMDLFVKISFLERTIFIVINVFAIRYGLVQLNSIKDQLYIKGFFKWASFIFIGFNALALIFNLFGRVSLSHTLSLAAIIALTQIIALSVLLKVILEVILLQIYTTRIKRGINKLFDHESLSQNLKKPFVLIISYMWIVVIASNLNIWESLHDAFSRLLSHPNTIGSVTFTLGSVLLFCILIWIAHLLQKYVAYFFGEVDDEDEENINKRQHSKLLVTRLVVLIVGYLLAIAASGMPLDKLSILLGALGVGVGLGLQNIVSNFVSGVILIFDKPIQVGDVIDVSSQSGRVKSMGLRTTKLDSSNGAEVIIPNGNILSQNITNWTYTDNLKQVEIAFTLQGDMSTERINEIVKEALDATPVVSTAKIPQIYYNSISDDNYKLLIKFWCSIYRTEEAISTTKQSLHLNFKNQGIAFSTT